ncbi:hypothetical protein BRD00_04260 [Halobacteriales archaeon QS_8_69_26]|nr:MAG: hypothetical protein BRD00_04260 [Halobacteriales archaeon QS_8_69_26]
MATGHDEGVPWDAGLGFAGGILWATYPTALASLFRGAAPGQPPYAPDTVVYAQLLAVPLALVLVGIPAVRGLPGADGPWGRRGVGLVALGASLVALGVLAVTIVGIPGRVEGPVAAVAPAGLLVLQFGGTFLGYGLWSHAGGSGGWTDPPDGEVTKLRRVAGGLLLLALPGTLLGILGTRLLYSAVPFYAGVAVPVGLGWAGACYAVLAESYGED